MGRSRNRGEGTAPAAPPLSDHRGGQDSPAGIPNRSSCACPNTCPAAGAGMSDEFQGMKRTLVMNAVMRWVDFYSRHVPSGQGETRRDELISDMYEQQADALRRGLPVGAADRSIASRAVRGIFADITWGRIQNNLGVETVASPIEKNPAHQSLAGKVSAVLWAALVAVAAIGLISSIIEMIDTGGQRHGLTPWPGAANISLTVLVLTGSASVLAFTAVTGALKWRSSKRSG